MPINGSGPAMGAALMAAIGNIDPAAIPEFGQLMTTIGAWALTNIQVLPGTMVSAGAAVSGLGALKGLEDGTQLGQQLATAMKDPSEQGVTKWTQFAKALVTQMETTGGVNPAGFVAPTPAGGPLTGTGLLDFTPPAFTPPLSTSLTMADEPATAPIAKAMVELWGATIIAQLKLVATVVPVALAAPFIPLTAPPGGGPISGAGSVL